jgi:hypothetical protein
MAEAEAAEVKPAKAARKIRMRASHHNTLNLKSLPNQAQRLFDIQGGRCYLTGQPMTWKNPPTWEHVMPKAHGGRRLNNLLLAGFYANLDKGDRRPYPCELLYLRVANEIVRDWGKRKGPGC